MTTDPPLFSWEDSQGTPHALSADSVVQMNAVHAKELTAYPAEDGSDVSDHVIYRPSNLVLQLAQTQTPIKEDSLFAPAPVQLEYTEGPVRVQTEIRLPNRAPTSLLGRIFSPSEISATGSTLEQTPARSTQVSVLQAGQRVDRVLDFYGQLVDLHNNNYRIEVVFRGKIFPNMILTEVSWDNQPGEVGLGRFTVQLSEFATVETERVANLVARPRGVKPLKAGSEAEQEARTERANKSQAAALLDAAGELGSGASAPPDFPF